MSLLGQSAGLLFKIDADASGAKKELAAMDSAVGKLGSQFESFSGAASVAAVGIAAIGAAVLTTGRVLFDLSKTASDYGSAIFDASQKTGLSATSLSALKVAADQSGASLETVTKAIARFAKSYEGTGTNITAELGKVFEQIKNASSGFERLTIAQKNFGKGGADLIPVILATGGNLEAFTAEMERLGLTINDEAAQAADEFGDTLDMLGAQAAGIGRIFANEFMPEMTEGMQAISDAMAENKDIARQWGTVVGDILHVIRLSLVGAVDVAADQFGYLNSAVLLLTGNLADLKNILDALSLGSFSFLTDKIGQYTEDVGQRANQTADFNATVAAITGIQTAANRAAAGPSREVDDQAAAKRRKEAEQRAERDRRAGIGAESNNFKIIEGRMRAEYERLRQQFEVSPDEDFLLSAANAIETTFAKSMDASLDYIESLENKLRSTLTENEKVLLTQDQQERRDRAVKAITEEKKKALESVTKVYEEQDKAAEILFDAEMKRSSARIDAIIKEREEMQATTDFFIQQLSGSIATAIGMPQGQDGEGGIFDSWTESWMNFLGAVEFGAPTLTATMTEISGMLQNAFQGMANALGQVVQQWVLYGETGPGVMRKVLASALATIAAEAAVRAIYSAAMGFFFLATHQYTDATNAFISAAVFGSIAGVAAVAGRAVAGNAFKQQSSAGATAGTSTRSTSTQGGAYSGSDTMTINGGRNAPESVGGGAFVIRDKSGMFDSLFEMAWERNGRMRQTLRAEFAT